MNKVLTPAINLVAVVTRKKKREWKKRKFQPKNLIHIRLFTLNDLLLDI